MSNGKPPTKSLAGLYILQLSQSQSSNILPRNPAFSYINNRWKQNGGLRNLPLLPKISEITDLMNQTLKSN